MRSVSQDSSTVRASDAVDERPRADALASAAVAARHVAHLGDKALLDAEDLAAGVRAVAQLWVRRPLRLELGQVRREREEILRRFLEPGRGREDDHQRGQGERGRRVDLECAVVVGRVLPSG